MRLFAMFAGVVPEDFLGHEPWQFLVKTLFCTRLLMDVNWRLLVRAWPTERGAPLPVPAVMDLLANLYNAENPTQLPVRTRSGPRAHACMSCMYASLDGHVRGDTDDSKPEGRALAHHICTPTCALQAAAYPVNTARWCHGGCLLFRHGGLQCCPGSFPRWCEPAKRARRVACMGLVRSGPLWLGVNW